MTESLSNIDSNMHKNPKTNPISPASPFFIQLGEGASSPLVPDLLTTGNYVTWARTMRRALKTKKKLGFIDGKIPKPYNDSDEFYAPWECCNDMIITWIQHSVGLEHRSSIAHAYTTANIWNDLREWFSIQNAPRIFQLIKSISSLTQDDTSVSQYYNQLKGFWDELEIYEPMSIRSCGVVKTLLGYSHKSRVIQLLMELDISYDSVRAQILLHDPLLPLNRVLSLVQ